MPRTEPAPTWPLPTSWKIDFARREAQSRSAGSAARPAPCSGRARTAASARATSRRRARRAPTRRRSSCSRARRRTTRERRTRSRSRRTPAARHADARGRSPPRGCAHGRALDQRSPSRIDGQPDAARLRAGRRWRPTSRRPRSPSEFRSTPQTESTVAPHGRRSWCWRRAASSRTTGAPRGRRHRPRRARRGAGRAARPERRGQDHDAVDDPRRRRARRGIGRRSAASTSRAHRSRAAECVGFAAGYLPLTERMRVREYLRLYGQLYGLADPGSARSTRVSSGSGSRTSPTRWAPSCRRASAR